MCYKLYLPIYFLGRSIWIYLFFFKETLCKFNSSNNDRTWKLFSKSYNYNVLFFNYIKFKIIYNYNKITNTIYIYIHYIQYGFFESGYL